MDITQTGWKRSFIISRQGSEAGFRITDEAFWFTKERILSLAQ
jgi:hypothetical protein